MKAALFASAANTMPAAAPTRSAQVNPRMRIVSTLQQRMPQEFQRRFLMNKITIVALAACVAMSMAAPSFAGTKAASSKPAATAAVKEEGNKTEAKDTAAKKAPAKKHHKVVKTK